jgi:DNA modification methylase
MTSYQLHHGDCLEVMATMADNSVDAIVTDPPYGLSFMGKNWDHGVPGEAFWREALRVAKPGAHLLAFGGTRTFHRLAVAIEDAGWEIRDCVMWVYGSGFPKSLDVSKAIDKAAGAEREVVGEYDTRGIQEPSKSGKTSSGISGLQNVHFHQGCKSKITPITAPATPEALQWQGWGTALKPAWEPVIVTRKPLEGTVAANVLKHGTGAINIDGCRVGTDAVDYENQKKKQHKAAMGQSSRLNSYELNRNYEPSATGRWPANVIHDGSEKVVGLFPVTGNNWRASKGSGAGAGMFGVSGGVTQGQDDSGSAARFFYCAKASKRDRGEGNTHPTVKPTDLMRYLCRLVTPPDGIVLDPFMGSGSTGKAAILEGFQFIGIEREAEYLAIAKARIKAISPVTQLSLL